MVDLWIARTALAFLRIKPWETCTNSYRQGRLTKHKPSLLCDYATQLNEDQLQEPIYKYKSLTI